MYIKENTTKFVRMPLWPLHDMGALMVGLVDPDVSRVLLLSLLVRAPLDP
jgi:hypothetical protein